MEISHIPTQRVFEARIVELHSMEVYHEYAYIRFRTPAPWNKGKLIGQKAPRRINEIWAIRVRLEIYRRRRELALFNLAIDSKLRGCDLVQLRVTMFPTATMWPAAPP